VKRVAIIVLISVTLGGCFVWAAGKDPAAQHLQAQVEQVATSVKAYRSKYGVLPAKLELLVPEFVSSLPLHINLRYNSTSGSIGFTYSPSWPQSGQASCITGIEQIQWHCVGYL
jgi:hypothetical protein